MRFQDAVESMQGERQKILAEASADINHRLGIQGHDKSVIGAWEDGAENGLMVSMPKASLAEARVATAMKAYLAGQKSALIFQPSSGGRQFMASFHAHGDLHEIHDRLLRDGLNFHTLEPTNEGAIVHVYGSDQATVKIASAMLARGSS